MLSTNAQGQTFKTLSPKPLSRPKAIAVHIFCRLGNQSRRGFRVDVGLSHELQRRQSGLKSIGSWIRVKKKSIFPCRQIFEEFWLFQAILLKKIWFFQANFRKISIFQSTWDKISNFQAQIGHLKLHLGKLFYFSSKVITFEHTSCTW